MSQMPETTTEGRIVITTNNLHVDPRDIENVPEGYKYDGFHAYDSKRVYHYYRKADEPMSTVQYSSALASFAPDLADVLVKDMLSAMEADSRTKDKVLAWALAKGIVRFPD